MSFYGKVEYGHCKVIHNPTGMVRWVTETSEERAIACTRKCMDLDFGEESNMSASLSEKLPVHVFINKTKHPANTQVQMDHLHKMMAELSIESLDVYNEDNQLTGEVSFGD